jgi:hypothetical protein
MTQLQQGFWTDGMGSDRHFAWQQSSGPNVTALGHKQTLQSVDTNVRFASESGH